MFAAGQTGVQFQLCLLVPRGPGKIYFCTANFTFLIVEVGTMIAPTLQVLLNEIIILNEVKYVKC